MINKADHAQNNPEHLPKPETESTESYPAVPKHTLRKDFWHYFFEFLMVFLAVLCGFIADNWRETLQEHRREKVFIRSIVEDIKSDTLNSNLIIKKLKGIKAGIDSVLDILAAPEFVYNTNQAYRIWTQNQGLEVFVSNDRTIQQLKSSGELRLIRDKAVSDRIMEYDQTLRKYYTQSNLMYSALSDISGYSQLFDFISLRKNPNIPVPLTEEGKKYLNMAYARLEIWDRGLSGLISWLEVVHKEGTQLVIFIDKEYHLNYTE